MVKKEKKERKKETVGVTQEEDALETDRGRLRMRIIRVRVIRVIRVRVIRVRIIRVRVKVRVRVRVNADDDLGDVFRRISQGNAELPA